MKVFGTLIFGHRKCATLQKCKREIERKKAGLTTDFGSSMGERKKRISLAEARRGEVERVSVLMVKW